MEHQEDDHAGDRNVKPNRKSETRNSLVGAEPTAEREQKGHQHHRQRDDRKHDVRGENGKIDLTVSDAYRIARLPVKGVICYVAQQE